MDYFSAVSSNANANANASMKLLYLDAWNTGVSLSVTYFPKDACGIDTNSGRESK